ncbi:MAG TPA: hypothetical protein VF147_14225 [Vicinamibacterales bacterium]
MGVRAVTLSLILAAPLALLAAQPVKQDGAPETFRANGQMAGGSGGVASVIDFTVDKYTSDADHEALVTALKGGDYNAFVQALRKAPAVGSVKIGNRTVPIRWARQKPDTYSRRVILVAEGPVFFFGAGAADAKPTEGYDLAIAEFTVDNSGLGKGTMAPAARVKLGGPSGVQIDDYSGKAITLVTVTRNIR